MSQTQSKAKESKSDSKDFGPDELFFGSQRVHLKPCPGFAINYEHKNYSLGSSKEEVKRVVNRKNLIPMDDGGLPITLPAVPALDPVCNGEPSREVSSWPTFLRQPLIKVKPEQKLENEPVAFASGTRSATLKIDGKYFRLKGCGNNDEGFIVRNETNLGFRDIRGSAFVHTSLCELYNTKALYNFMGPGYNANESLGYYVYTDPNAPLGDVCPPACIVERTHGDRRLGTHVLAGLELLLPSLIDAKAVDMKELKATFPSFRENKNTSAMGAADPVVPTSDFMADHQIAQSMSRLPDMPDMQGLTWTMARDAKAFADCLSVRLPETTPDAKTLPQVYFRENGQAGGPRPANRRWASEWAKACAELKAAIVTNKAKNNAPCGAVLTYLYSRIGHEAGTILRKMHDANTSWGTYADNMCFEGQLHCNAHNNNLVIMNQGTVPNRFLSYLDLDMAFSNEAFVDVYGSGQAGTDQKEHSALLAYEAVQMMEVLVGADATSGVPPVARKELSAHPPALRLVLNALRDTLMLGFLKAYKGEEANVAEPTAGLHAGAYALIKLAIIKQADYAA